MTQPDYTARIHSKWILAGEHSVLRGKPALVFPLRSLFLEMNFFDNPKYPSFMTSVCDDQVLEVFMHSLQSALRLLGKSDTAVSGEFVLANHVPISTNLGFSATICVAVAKWLVWRKLLDEANLFKFARCLEDEFHGTSSGVDIAGVISESGVRFVSDESLQPIKMGWQPKIYLSYSGATAATADCISMIKKLQQTNKTLAEEIDNQMEESVNLAQTALLTTQDKGLTLLANALEKASSCFRQWGIVGDVLEKHFSLLMAAGALAVKPTGSGSGGYVISLWDKEPLPQALPFELVSGF